MWGPWAPPPSVQATFRRGLEAGHAPNQSLVNDTVDGPCGSLPPSGAEGRASTSIWSSWSFQLQFSGLRLAVPSPSRMQQL